MDAVEVAQRLSQITTHWSLIFRANQAGDPAATAAQGELLMRYGGAIFRYLRSVVEDVHAVEDLCQEFAVRLVRGDFRQANPDRGHFRSLVKAALFHLVADYRRRRQVRLRLLPCDSAVLAATPAPDGPVEEDFTRLWRAELLDRAWEALAAVEKQTGQPFYTALRLRAEQPGITSAELAGRLGPTVTPNGARQTLHRARARFADLLLEEVGRSLQTTELDPIAEELRDLDLGTYCQAALDRRRNGG